MMKRLLGITLTLLLCIVSVAAKGENVSVVYDEEKEQVVVSGAILSNFSNYYASISVYFDTDKSKTYTDGDTLYYLTTVDTTQGTESYSFQLVERSDVTKEAPSGYYIVRCTAFGPDTMEETLFYYMSKEEKKILLRDINYATASELDMIITSNVDAFDVEGEAYAAADKEFVLPAVLGRKPEAGFAAIGDFVDVLKEMMGCDALKKATTPEQVEAVFDEYGEYFDIDTAKLYPEFKKMTDEQKTTVYGSLVSVECEDGTGVRAEYDSAVAFCLINSTKQWGTLKTALENYIGYLAIDLEYYNDCNKEDLAVALIDHIPYSTKKELSDAIKDFAEDEDSDDDSSGGGSGGSSGGSKGAPSYMVTSPAVSQSGVNGNVVADEMAQYAWAKEAVNALKAMGAVNGYENGQFAPAAEITREEFLKILLVSLKMYEAGANCSYSDVPADNWAYPYIACATQKGIVNGMGDGRFGYGQKITRQDMAVMVYRAIQMANVELEAYTEKTFTDFAKISDYAKDSVKILGNSGVINGYEDGSFRPFNNVIRAEAAVMIYNAVGGE